MSPRKREGGVIEAPPESQALKLFPRALCDHLWEVFSERVGVFPYGRFRKALALLFVAKAATADEADLLVQAIKLYGTATQDRTFGTSGPEDFVQRWRGLRDAADLYPADPLAGLAQARRALGIRDGDWLVRG